MLKLVLSLSKLWLIILLVLGSSDMSLANELLHRFPQQIPTGASNGVLMEQKPGYFALHGNPLPVDRAVLVFEPEGIAILQGNPPSPLAPKQAISPVYGPKEGGGLAVPTGQVFIRFKESETAAAHRTELEQEGFTIIEELDYAPQAAWLRARSGSIAEALGGVPRLLSMAAVEAVEPQLLMERSQREGDSGNPETAKTQ
jgi:hypothetical protein